MENLNPNVTDKRNEADEAALIQVLQGVWGC